MPEHVPVTDAERADLRRLFLAAPRGTWIAPMSPTQRTHVLVERPDGSRERVGEFDRADAAQLVAAAVNVLPRIFADLDEARRRARPRQAIPILGSIG